MPLYLLKFPYRKILLPLARKMKFIDPDILGYLAVAVAFMTMLCYIYATRDPNLLIVSIFLTLLRMTLNTIDGVIAIERGNLRLKGEIVNALPDRYSDALILSGLALSGLCSFPWALAAIATVFLVSYTGMLSKAIGCLWQHDGPLGKVERLILIMFFSLFQYLNIIGVIGKPWGINWFELLMILFVILGQITVYNRLKAQLAEAAKLDWIKYREDNNLIKGKALILYDSMTGNTEKCAMQMSDALMCEIINIKDETPNLSDYDLVIFASPNIRKEPTPLFKKFLNSEIHVKSYAVFITSGMPIWRHLSSPACVRYFEERIGRKALGKCDVIGYHAKYKTYRGRPNERDLLKSYLFAVSMIKKVSVANA